jgi:hypothetical protein
MTGLKPEEIARAAKLEADIHRMKEKYGDGFRGNEYTAATKNRRMQ